MFRSKRKPEDAELDRELRFHIDSETETNIRAGMSPEQARRQALIEFGGREQFKEELRDVHRTPVVDAAISNLKAATRFIRKSPTFAAAIVLTLGLGIGANTAVFSAINAVLLRPLPFPNGDALVRVAQRSRKTIGPPPFVAPVRVEDWNRLNTTFEALTGYYTENTSETSGALPERVTEALVTGRFLQVWGIAPALGRDFNQAEAHFGGPQATILTDRFWRNRFGANPDVIGKALHIGRASYTIIGVLPASFAYSGIGADFLIAAPSDAPFAQSRESTWYTVIGRIKRDVTLSQARADLAAVQTNLGRQFPKTDADLVPDVQPLKELTVAGSRRSLWLIFGAVSLLLLIACTNIAALLLARATQRQPEIAIRFSLGASRAAVMWQLLTEAFVLALGGAILGGLAAAALMRFFREVGKSIPRIDEMGVDWRLVLYTLVITISATMLCALVPALRATRTGLAPTMSQSGRTQVASGRSVLQWTLVGVQVALAVTLLVGAGLLLRSFQELGRVSPGFDPNDVLTLHVNGSYGETTDIKRLTLRINRTLEAIESVPGVERAATAAVIPGIPNNYSVEMKMVENESGGGSDRKIVAENRFVSAGYFAALRIPLLSGSSCPALESPPSILVNRSFASTYLNGTDPAGRHLKIAGNNFMSTPGEIRGVVGDAREKGIDQEPAPTVYWCVSAPVPDPNFLIRTAPGTGASLANAIRMKIRDVSPARSVYDLQALDQRLRGAYGENRLRAMLLGFFAVTSISLACIGLYGTLSYLVQIRRREVGLRLALGSVPGQIVGRFLAQGLAVSAAGCAAGVVLSLLSGKLLAGMLYGVTDSDPATILAVIAIVLGVASFAALVPAVRAARLDPMRVLREE